MATDFRCTCPMVFMSGNSLQFTEGKFTLSSGPDGVRCHVAFEDEESGHGAELELIAGPGGKRGHLRTNRMLASLFDDVALVENAFPSGDDEASFVGLEGDFSFPHHGPFRRLRSVFVGVQDEKLIEALAVGWASEEATNVAHLPWTIESLMRFAAAHARTLPDVKEVVETEPGQLTLRLSEGSHHADLHNLLARVRAEPEAALDRITEFFAATTPAPDEEEDGSIVFRVMRAPALSAR